MMDMLTSDEAAEILRVSLSTISRYVRSGEIRAARLPGGQYRIPRTEVDRLLELTVEPAVAS